MKYCDKCGVTVAGERRYCPLCQRELRTVEGDSRETYPKIPTVYKSHNLFFRALIFVSVVVSILAVMLNILIPTQVWWSFFVVAGVFCMWLSLSVAVNERRNIQKNIVYQVIILSLLCVLWDWLTEWRGWSIDYVIPIACATGTVTLGAIAKIRKLKFEDYVIYALVDILFGIIPTIFLLVGNLGTIIPSLICVAGSLIFLSALILFRGEQMRAELKRRLHL